MTNFRTLLPTLFAACLLSTPSLAQQISVKPIADATVSEKFPRRNMGESPSLVARRHDHHHQHSKIYLCFDIRELPDGVVAKASLKLTVQNVVEWNGKKPTLQVYGIIDNKDWNPMKLYERPLRDTSSQEDAKSDTNPEAEPDVETDAEPDTTTDAEPDTKPTITAESAPKNNPASNEVQDQAMPQDQQTIRMLGTKRASADDAGKTIEFDVTEYLRWARGQSKDDSLKTHAQKDEDGMITFVIRNVWPNGSRVIFYSKNAQESEDVKKPELDIMIVQPPE